MTILVKGQQCAELLSLSGGYAYWYDQCTYGFYRVPQNGGAVQNISTSGSDGQMQGTAVQNGFLYWTFNNFSSVSNVFRTNVTSGKSLRLYEGIVTRGVTPDFQGVAVSPKYVFFTNGPVINRISLTGSSRKVIAKLPSASFPIQLQYSNGSVFG